jgi:hypothetical protein
MLHPKSAILIVPYNNNYKDLKTYQAVQKIFWLNIPMDDILGMEILQCNAHLSDVIGCNRFSITLIWLFLQIFVEFTSRCILKY